MIKFNKLDESTFKVFTTGMNKYNSVGYLYICIYKLHITIKIKGY